MSAQLERVDCDGDLIPEHVREKVARFILDNRTGNVTLNVRDGRVLGLTIEEKLSV